MACEFDHYLLQRSTARLELGAPITSIRKEGARWIVNDAVTARMLVGAGGHFCPVARSLNSMVDRAPGARLAYAPSGEGIRPAIESGLLAAATILEAGGDYTRQRIEPYQERLRERFGLRPRPGPRSETMLSGFAATLLPSLFNMPWFVRHLLRDRWFLRAHEPPLAIPWQTLCP